MFFALGPPGGVNAPDRARVYCFTRRENTNHRPRLHSLETPLEAQLSKTIQIIGTTVLRGPNMWTYQPAIEALVDIGDLEDFPSNTIPGLYDRLKAWLPSLIEHRCSYEERGGFLRRLEDGTWPVHIMEHVAIELQCLAGGPGGFGRARETSRRSLYKLIVGTWHEEITRTAITLARDLVQAAYDQRDFDVAAAIETLIDLADDYALGPSTACIVSAADDRKIPFIRLNDGNLVQLGYGANQRRIWTAETDLTSAIAEGISRDKDLTKQLLRSCGVPCPKDVWSRMPTTRGPPPRRSACRWW